jgi:hypothetical protein
MSRTRPEAEGYLDHIKKDVSNEDTDISNYAKLLEENTQNLIDGNITIEQFGNISPNNNAVKVSHLNHMRNAIINSWHLREDRLKKMAEEANENN